MKKNPYLFFFLLLFVPFLAYFLRPDFIGSDPYGFLLLTCQKDNVAGITGIPFIIFSNLPCSFIALKVMLFALAFVSGVFLIKMASLFSKENGWRAGYLIFLSTVLVLDFVKLENEAFAIPFLFASQYFFFKSLKGGTIWDTFFCFGSLVVAGLLWTGAVFYIIAYTLNIALFAIASIPILLIYGRNLVATLLGNVGIAEDLPFKFRMHFILNIGLLGALLEPMLMPQAVFFFALGTASARFWILSLPFLVTGGVLLLERFDKEWLNSLVMVLAVVSVLGLAQSVFLNPPQPEQWEAIDYALSIDENINNPWGWGYWVLWRGGKTSSFQSPNNQQAFVSGQVTIVEGESTCPLLKGFRDANVLKC